VEAFSLPYSTEPVPKNNGNSLLKCIAVGQRFAHDVCDYPNLKKRLYRNKGLKWNLVDIENIGEDVLPKV
jgi:uncharacterized cupin superfamily protein